MAVIFTLTAVFMNRSHRNIMFALSYVVAGITLLTYEPFYLLFALAPWLHRPLQTLKIRKVGFHLASVFAIFVAFVAVRQYMDVRPMDTVTGAMTPSEIVVSVGLGELLPTANSVRFLPLFLNFTDYRTRVGQTGVLAKALGIDVGQPRIEEIVADTSSDSMRERESK